MTTNPNDDSLEIKAVTNDMAYSTHIDLPESAWLLNEAYPTKIQDKVPGIDRVLYWPLKDSGTFGFINETHHSGPVGDWFATHKDVIEQVPNKRVCIQAGGAMGLYPLLLANQFEAVFTFEPTDINWHFLTKNVDGAENIIAAKACLGNELRSDVTMQIVSESNLGMNRVHSVGTGNIEMVTLDSIFGEEVDNVDLIWLDLEGFEWEAIQGGKKLIERCRPVVGVENMTQPIVDYFEQIGYKRAIHSQMDTFFFPEN
jgi:FkbM family methyltransferase